MFAYIFFILFCNGYPDGEFATFPDVYKYESVYLYVCKYGFNGNYSYDNFNPL